MLRKFVLIGISALLILPLLSSVSNAVILVPDFGETGWQTYSHIFDKEWEGSVGIGVSDYGDEAWGSILLIDNFVGMGAPTNPSFEAGDFTGYG
jgi:hypothetical protein